MTETHARCAARPDCKEWALKGQDRCRYHGGVSQRQQAMEAREWARTELRKLNDEASDLLALLESIEEPDDATAEAIQKLRARLVLGA